MQIHAHDWISIILFLERTECKRVFKGIGKKEILNKGKNCIFTECLLFKSIVFSLAVFEGPCHRIRKEQTSSFPILKVQSPSL